ncbi:MAG: polyprenyl synthetase family protein [Planctomycetes bacterium]|nr:polyprenyl synthetase family protein [Planctomycetota bacterium]
MQLPSHSDVSLRSKASAAGGQPQSTVPSFKLIDDELGQVKKLIEERLAEASEPVSRLLRNVSVCSGKMIRPGLVLLSYHAVREGSCPKGLTAKRAGNTEKSPGLRKPATSGGSAVSENHRNTHYDAICVAAIVELIHNATLLHDDVIDGGQKRRGLPTVNTLRGNESAVLLGDFLLSKAFKICAELGPEITNIVAGTAVRVCEGELRQVTERQNWQLSESEYIDIITEKSAALFSSCCLVGGLLAGASETQILPLADFGLKAGIAFQITDDLLDIIGDESKTGKTLGRDIDKNKLTLAVIHLLRAVEKTEQSAVINSYLVNPEAHLEGEARCQRESLVEMLGRLGSLEYAHRRAQEFVTKARDALTELREGQAKDALIETAKFFGERAI